MAGSGKLHREKKRKSKQKRKISFRQFREKSASTAIGNRESAIEESLSYKEYQVQLSCDKRLAIDNTHKHSIDIQ